MGTSRTGAELAAKVERFAKDMGDVRIPLEATAQRGKQIFLAAGGGAIGATIAGKRKAIGARYDLRNRKSGLGEGQAIVTYTGPAHLLNNSTRPHVIVARRLGRTRKSRRTAAAGIQAGFSVGSGLFRGSGSNNRSGAAALTIGGDLRAYARHPGTRGRRFFQRAAAIAEHELPRTYQNKGLTEPLRRAFG